MIQSRRTELNTAVQQPTSHAGLWFDKYIVGQLMKGETVPSGESTPQAKLVVAVSDPKEPEIYRQFFGTWERSLQNMGVITRKASVQGRLSIGLGGEAVLETAITLHRTYGVPYIPGSALKGLAASYARNRLDEIQWNNDSEAYRVMFGDTSSAGYITFFDALYIPGSGHDGKALWPDVITVHHPEYYQGDKPPADWDSPTPIPFLSATGEYLVAIGGETRWVETAFKILGHALEEVGIGAKTSSGYGRMRFEDTLPAPATSAGRGNEPYAVVRRRLLRDESPPPGRTRGTVTDVRRNGELGNINPARGGGKVFVHWSQLKPKGKRLQDGQVVEYQIGKHEGKDQAQNVDVLLNPQ